MQADCVNSGTRSSDPQRMFPQEARTDNGRHPPDEDPLGHFQGRRARFGYGSAVKSVLMIVNASAGGGSNARKAQAAAQLLRSAGVQVALLETHSVHEALDGIHRLAPGLDAVVPVGGDGTIRGILPAVLETRLPIGLIPAGTANVVARELGIPRRVAGAVRALLTGRPIPWDLGQINGQWFLAMIGVGLDASIVSGVASGKGKLRRLAWKGIRQLVRPPDFELRVTRDGESIPGNIKSFVVCNTRNYGGWFSLAPDAKATDGRMDGVALRSLSRWAMLRFVGAASVARHPSRSVASTHPGHRFLIESADPQTPAPVQADGDPLGCTPVTVSVFPKALHIFAPSKTPNK